MKATTILSNSLKDFYRDNGITHAASIAYSGAMTVVPFCLLMVAVLGHILGSDQQLLSFFVAQLTTLFPSTGNEIADGLKNIIAHRSISGITIVVYLIFSFQLFMSIEATTNEIFKETKKRTILMSLTISLGIITAITSVIVISFLATSAVSLVEKYSALLSGIKVNQHYKVLVGYAMPLFMLFLITTALYKLIPIRSIPISAIIPGAAFTAVLFEAAKHAFTFYVLNMPNVGLVYGSLWAFFIFLTWLYYTACVFLIGAEIVHNLDMNGK